MSLLKGMTAIALLTCAASLQAADIDFNYVDVNVGIFDLDFDQTVSSGGDTISLQTDDDVSFYASGAWQPFEGSVGWFTRVHVFAAAGISENDLEGSITSGTVTTSGSGSLDIIQARVGVGYSQPLFDDFNLYGRVTWDYFEFKDADIGIIDFDDVDESGVGGEAGARWLIRERFELQGYVRYSDNGKIEELTFDNIELDDDIIGGVAGRWYFTDRFALQVNGEFGESTTYGAGLRFAF